MHISKRDANQIVNEMSNIIGQDINMMDSKGAIIASTDSTRVGQIHGVAQKIIDQNLDEMIVENNFEYEGTKQGVNMPILFDGETIGVIGITGESDKVKKYGQIIKKMTEILILDIYVKEQKSIKDQIKNRYLDKWISGKISNTDQSLINEGLNIGIDITLPYRIMIVANMSCDNNIANEQIIMDEIGRTIKRILSEKDGNFMISRVSSIVCLINACNDAQMMFLAQTISKQIQLEYGVTLAIGVDSSADSHDAIYVAYEKAEKALKTALSLRKSEIEFYDNIDIGIFINEIPDSLKEEFVHRIFRGCSQAEVAQWTDLLKVFYEANGSIKLSSDKLFIHKNTLQYKLNKLFDITGYNPREMLDAALFILAIEFNRDNHRSDPFV